MKSLRNERGAILMFTLGMMVALLLIGVASSLFTRSERRFVVNLRGSTRALYAAEAGLGWVHARLRGADPVLYADPTATLDGDPVGFGGGSYEVTVGARDGNGRRIVTALGRNDGIERSVTARFRRFGLDPSGTQDCLGPGDADADGICDGRSGIVSNHDVVIPAGSRVDSYHGEAGSYVAGSDSPYGGVATNGTLLLAGSSTVVRGDVFVGRGFEPGPNTLEGEKRLVPAFYLPPLPDHATVCSGYTNPALDDCDPPVLAGSPPEETLTVGSGQTVCMPPEKYCFRRIHVQGGGTLRIVVDDPESIPPFHTTIRLGTHPSGKAVFDVQGRLEYGTGMRPNLLRVFAHGDVEVAGWSGGQLFGLFYAPRSAVRLNTNTANWTLDVYGLAAGDRVVFGSGRVRFHVDEDGTYGDFCGDAGNPTCRPAFVIREAWQEDRG